MASEPVFWDTDSSDDDDAISLTSTVSSVQKDEYELEAILAEKTENDTTLYLVKWEGYHEFRSTWEVPEHFQNEQTLRDWADQKMRISRGLAPRFDLLKWERDKENLLARTRERRQQRRDKKVALGLSVADLPSENEASTEEDPSDDNSNQADEEVESLHWTPKEEGTLLEALQRLKGPKWNSILKLYGPRGIVNQNLGERTEADIQRKTIALKKAFDASGKEFPISMELKKPQDPIKGTKTVQSLTPSRRSSVNRRDLTNESTSPTKRSLGTVEDMASRSLATPRTPKENLQPNRRPDQYDTHTRKKPEVPRLHVPPRPDKAVEPRGSKTGTHSASTPTGQLPRGSGLPKPVSREEPRSTQLGTVGRGPARAGPHIAKQKDQGINVLGNWGAQPLKRRKSRYTMMTAHDIATKPANTFKKFSTRRKFELAGRREQAPDVNSLTFVNLRDGKPLPKGQTSNANPAPTPFEMLQRRLSLQHDENPSILNENVPETNSTSPVRRDLKRSETAHPGSKEVGSPTKASNTPPVANAPPRRASMPLEVYSERNSKGQPFSAPVALMKSVQNKNKDQASSDHQDALPKSSARRGSSITVDAAAPTKQVSGDHSAGPTDTESTNIFQERREMPQSNTLADAMPVKMQPREDGYALFPMDTLPVTRLGPQESKLQLTDVIAEILTGSKGQSTGSVIFRGLADVDLKHLFITIRVYPKQMHVWCKTMLTVGEYVTYFHDPTSYRGSGWIVPYHDTISQVDSLSSVWSDSGSGGIFFAPKFSILVYPANCIGWEFLDQGFPSVPFGTKLRFAMFAPWPRIQQDPAVGRLDGSLPRFDGDPQMSSINKVFQTQFGLDFHRLIAQANDKDGSKARRTSTFFMIFPAAAQEELQFITEWIRSNKTATIYRHEDTGSWDYLVGQFDPTLPAVIICHGSFYHYWAIPRLEIGLRKTFSMFNLSLESMPDLSPDVHATRLFSTAASILLTDSFLLQRPSEAAQLLAWFRLCIIPTKPNPWKICTRPAIREWLLKLQETSEATAGQAYMACLGEVMRLLPVEMTQEGDRERPKDFAPIACMSKYVSNFDHRLGTGNMVDPGALARNDETLVHWFAGWAMTKQEKYRRFQVVSGTTDEKELYKTTVHLTKKYNHISIVTFEKFAKAKWNDVLSRSQLDALEEKRRNKIKMRDAQRLKQAGVSTKEGEKEDVIMQNDGAQDGVGDREGDSSYVDAKMEDVEMRDVGPVGEESLFLPMDMSSPR
ncbi:MAG: hypothetical protein Q9174_001045 [Haloplaca sp. 1 TL-2023]